MCFDNIHLIHYACGHGKPTGNKTRVNCGSRRCAFSSIHPQYGCANCVNTCRQRLLPPESIVTSNSPNLCSDCARGRKA
ncbi:hypothetical protein R3P38DRAFT_3070558 [Favolaschia claudopus]|uniref:Uncharacterized protein n=1 Tax=Favolaschia claudopus TaxID=2862362 RepID=A0AAW0A049_9AGAR